VRKYALALAVLWTGCGGGGEKSPAVADSAQSQASAPLPSRGATSDARIPISYDVQRPATDDTRRTLLFVGTSLTAGLGLEPEDAYPNLVQLKIDSAALAFDVVNAGVSGETSSALLRRMDWLLRQRFELVLIETGANDGLRGIPVATMESNIRQIIQRIRSARPEARIALMQMEAPPNLGRSYTQRFREVFPEVARSENVTLLPFLLEGVAGRREMNQGDGIHPNEAGSRIVAENVWKGLRPLLQ
jgi:acyl-CoA thioesterase-1